MKISVFSPEITKDDIELVSQALQAGEISGNYGKYLTEFENLWASYCGVKHGIAVTSGTTALHLAIAALEFPVGSEVLISSSTNIATALAVLHNNLVPVPVDSELITWNLDIGLIEKQISSKTVAIIPVHLFGQPLNMPLLMRLAEKYNLKVIEDCAESHGAILNGRMTGSFGAMGCFSFYANKILTTGEGGMVITNNDDLSRKLRDYRNLGFQEPRFLHKIAGYNFRMTGYQAALGVSQFHRLGQTLEKKIQIATWYKSLLSSNKYLSLQGTIPGSRNVYWVFGILLAKEAPISRDTLREILFQAGVETRTFFCPMDLQPVLRSRFTMQECPNAAMLWEQGIYLPSSATQTYDEVLYVATIINKALSE